MAATETIPFRFGYAKGKLAVLNSFADMDSDPRYCALPSAIGEQLGEEMAILNVETGTYFGLKGVGVDVWKLLERSPTLAEIVEHITREYEVDESRCRADVLTLLGQLQEARLIKAETVGHA